MKDTNNNLLIEGFNFLPTVSAITSQSGVTTSNRGKIVAVDIYATRETIPLSMYHLSLSVGGQAIVENTVNIVYDVFAYPGTYQLIPLEINDGQTFSMISDLILQAGASMTQVIFLRDGASARYIWEKRKLNTFFLTERFTSVDANTTFTGTIPKNRGKCVGFGVVPNDVRSTFDIDNVFIDFSIGGVQLIKNVTQSVFNPVGTRPYKTFFRESEAGDTFELTIRQTQALDTRFYDIHFYFEKE